MAKAEGREDLLGGVEMGKGALKTALSRWRASNGVVKGAAKGVAGSK